VDTREPPFGTLTRPRAELPQQSPNRVFFAVMYLTLTAWPTVSSADVNKFPRASISS
jgi:hypothetical protein